ncbi:MAG: radical SAM protein [Rickettsiales bacterium]|nr:radical SAM protein [Rickettsiales bacterium]
MQLIVDELVPLSQQGLQHVFHVPTSSFYEVGPEGLALLEEVKAAGHISSGQQLSALTGQSEEERNELLADLRRLRLVVPESEQGSAYGLRDPAPTTEGIRNFVMHVAHSCNLACTYCYADHGLYKGRATLMDQERARSYVDWLFDQGRQHKQLGITFFGGEPLLNMPVVREAARYARQKAQQLDKAISFSMTTNGTLVTEEAVDFFEEIDCQVTVSLDAIGKRNDRLRPFHSGKGSYDEVMERIQPLLARRSVAARVTVTRKNLDVVHTVDTLLKAGFTEVGCSPVDAKDPAFDLRGEDYEQLLDGFATLTDRFMRAALSGRLYGFSNIKNLLKAIHEGHNKEYPCGAGLQMVAGAPNGEMSLCHRFVGEKDFVLGRVQDGGLDKAKRLEVLNDIHLSQRSDCSSCWARYICSGGCHHVNFLFEGSPSATYKTHCDYLRAWYKLGLISYARMVSARPDIFDSPLQPNDSCQQ